MSEDREPAAGAAAPRVVSVTFVGEYADHLVATLRSVVELVDRCLVVGADGEALQAARGLVGDKLVCRDVDGGARAVARNAALAAAAETGADWAVRLDAGELLDAGGLDLRRTLGEATAAVLLVGQEQGYGGAERFFRLPAAGRYSGTVHETFQCAGAEVDTLEQVVFRLVDPALTRIASLHAEALRLAEQTLKTPDDPGLYSRLGDAYERLGRREEAIAAWQVCRSLPGDDEQAAWASYRAATAWLVLGDAARAVEACASGMARHAGLAELPWLAAFAAQQAGRHEQAVCWAQLAVALGRYVGMGTQVRRGGPQHPPAQWEGPFDVLRFALRALGDDAAAADAEQHWERARAAREEAQRRR